jgi:hypothetical protein
MAVPIDMTKGFSAGVPQKLFATPIAGEHNQYAVTKDGERFLLPVPGLPAPITVLLNWRARLGK